MPTKRQSRVAQQIHEVLSEILQFRVSDPRLSGVSIQGVDIDRELQYATIYVYSLGGEDEQEDVLEGLGSAAGYLRRELGTQIRTRHTPELRFEWDETPAQAAHIDALLDSLNMTPDEGTTDTESDAQ